MFSWLTLSLVAALAVSSAFAAPSARASPDFQPPTKTTGCPVSASVLQKIIPPGQTALVAPSSPPKFVGLGVGVQNYTCSPAGTFTNIGAYAELFDISCIAAAPIQTAAYNVWLASPQTTQQLVDTFGDLPFILGQHYFIANPTPGGANVPKFDFTSDRFKGDPTKFVIAARVGDIPAPTGPQDIDWLELNRTSGDLANQIFRVNTVAGTDSAACTAGQTASVKYVAKYFFY
ncbi:hypothetical protein PENSPDRAFT_683451 [Peniophora sp. CONT]|nr:hypothetical protein PENSPDRAFT_683451 [Peniophora sp. CONT]